MSPDNELLRVLDPARVAYWFFRLNGCFLIENFVVHPEADVDPTDNQQRTEADILGVRFHDRDELGMADVPELSDNDGRTVVFIAEIKRGGPCSLNGPWTKPSKRNIDRVLSAMGMFPPDQVTTAANELYEKEIYQNDKVVVRMIAVAGTINVLYKSTKENVIQMTWQSVLTFIHHRFHDYRMQKKDHGQWDQTGRTLWQLSDTSNPELFVTRVTKRFPLT